MSPTGKKHGPCEVACSHVDCARTRKDAAGKCPLCKDIIGYDRRFSKYGERLFHADCLEDAAEKRTLKPESEYKAGVKCEGSGEPIRFKHDREAKEQLRAKGRSVPRGVRFVICPLCGQEFETKDVTIPVHTEPSRE
jgi:hypothetical protein